MEGYSSSSSTTITYLTKNPKNEDKGSLISNQSSNVPTYNSSLHSVKKAPAKPWNKKPIIAPLPPTPPRVYKVDPVNFRDLVQKLTAAPQFLQTRRLRNVAPPPLDSLMLNDNRREVAVVEHSLSEVMNKEFSEALDHQSSSKGDDNKEASTFLELNLSPSSYNWCSTALFSPDTCTFLEQSKVV